jgi:serine/threonine protein phosphatase 1
MIEFIQAPASLPAGQRVYAIGDIHGCLDRLTDLHAAIGDDLAARPVAEPLLLHIGDYVDRGPDSASVVDTLARGSPVPGVPCVNLIGNHEEMMLEALAGDDPAAVVHWLTNGGADSLHSWGVPRAAPPTAWRGHIPDAHAAFLGGLALCHRAGGYLFVHAGLRPGIAIGEQERRDMLWIREPFLSWKRDFGAVVVHGHTPRAKPDVKVNRIGIDTGAVNGGMLSCAVLEEDRLGFLQA